MKTNELKKGDRVKLRGGWLATVMDNKKGNIRMCEVEGHYRELGSVYAHDIVWCVSKNLNIEHTPAQLKLKATMEKF